MKKSALSALAGITLAFVCFTLGFFYARNHLHCPVLISRIPAAVSTEPLPAATEAGPVFPLNLNTASAQELTALPGIGEVIARRIVDYRAQNGMFRNIEELGNVRGIGPARLEELRPYVSTGGN